MSLPLASIGDAVGTVFGVFYWIGILACAAYFWFSYARTSDHSVYGRRGITMAVAVGWPLYLAYLFFREKNSAASPQSGSNEAKKRILG